MADRFSGVVKLSDVNDFISASQDCVVTNQASTTAAKGVSKEPVKISLQDCLACSGCVTSAETALLENQSIDEFLRRVRDPATTVAVSISSPARAALSVAFGLPPLKLMRCLIGFLRSLGVSYIFDLNTAENLTLMAASEEFLQRYRAAKAADSHPLTLLASSCPGWVCYVEKTHGEWCIPHLATTRSAQATMGKLLKSHWCDRQQLAPRELYHCTIMSCYDKKLEAARPQFLSSDGVTPEVDSCLTSTEVVALIERCLEAGKSLERCGDRSGVYLDRLDGEKDACDMLYGVEGSSGGLLEYIYRRAAKSLFNMDVPSGPLPLKPLRNANFREICLEGADGAPLLRFAAVYGFRNIQALVQKIKRKQCPYDYVEVMACPSGCLNGGGQPKALHSTPTSHLEHISTAHRQVIPPGIPQMATQGCLGGERLETEFVRVKKSLHSLVLDW